MRKNMLGILLAGTIGPALTTGCDAASFGTARFSVPQQTQESAPVSDEADTSTANAADLTDYTLMICCDAGMIKPFQEIADSFKSAAGCEMNVTYANAGQIQSQITTPEEGDMFIAGLAGRLKPVESYTPGGRALMGHTPVLAVQSGNPKNIISPFGLAAEGVSLIIDDADSTPTGEVAKKALSDVGILDKIQAAISTATAPQTVTAIIAREVNTATIWKENYGAEGVEVVDSSGLEDYIKTVLTASLVCSVDHGARQAFLDYLNSGEARKIRIMYGYEIAE